MGNSDGKSDAELLEAGEQILRYGRNVENINFIWIDLVKLASTSSVARDKLGAWLEADPAAFIKGTILVNDINGGILFLAMISSLVSSEAVLKAICDILKRAISSELPNLLSVYLSVLAKYPTTSGTSQLPLLISLLDPCNLGQYQSKVRSLIILICKLYIDADHDSAVANIIGHFDLFDQHCSQNECALFACELESLYPLLPIELRSIYTSDQTRDLILSHAEAASSELALYKHRPIAFALVSNVLRLICTCSMTESCRDFNANHYLSLLLMAFSSKSLYPEINSYSALALIKIWPLIEAQQKTGKQIPLTIEALSHELITTLKKQVVIDDKGHPRVESESCYTLLDSCVESLMHLSIHASVRSSIRHDVTLLELLILLLRYSPTNEKISTHIVYGTLLIFSNATLMKAANQSSRQSTLDGLKEFSDPTTATSKSTKEQEQEIALFNRQLVLDNKFVEILTQLKIPKNESQVIDRTVALIVKIIFMFSLDQDRKMRLALVTQGGLTLILSVLMLLTKIVGTESRPNKDDPVTIETRLSAARAMAKILTSVDPQLAFKKYDVRTCITFLVELLGRDYSSFDGKSGVFGENANKSSSQITLIDQYELLLALTNLASQESNHQLRIQIVNRTFDQHLDYFAIDSDHPELQTATWELISNLVTEPICLAKLFNFENPVCKKRTSLAIKLLDSPDVRLQLVIGGLLANATSEYEFISTSLLDQKDMVSDLIRITTSIYRDQVHVTDLILRTSVLLFNLVSAAALNGGKNLGIFKTHQELKGALLNVIGSNENADVKAMLIECVKLIG